MKRLLLKTGANNEDKDRRGWMPSALYRASMEGST